MNKELKEKLDSLGSRLDEARGYIDFDRGQERIRELQQGFDRPGFWDNQETANRDIRELKRLKVKLEPWVEFIREYEDLRELAGMIEEGDAASLDELKKNVEALEEKFRKLELELLLSGENDANNAILSIHAGAGGTESCDWAAMLLRMYRRWAENKSHQVEVIDYLPGEEAGVKSVTIIVRGLHAFGRLKGERGVHRLVRISPFDSNRRRHTSFVSVDVIPEIEEEIEIEVKEKDIRVDVYRATGPGGQGVNTTDSAVRITHLATGIVVQCQNERSQLKNRATAMKVLKARLHEIEKQKIMDKQAKEYAAKQEIAWGSQIRSYVLHPYTMIKDHRTKLEVGNAAAVLDGEIDQFTEAYLRMRANKL